MIDLHIVLGLGLRAGTAAAIAPLTSHKDHEIMVIGDQVGDDFLFLIQAVVNMYNQVRKQSNMRKVFYFKKYPVF